MEILINNTLLDMAYDEKIINHFEYGFVKGVIDMDKLAMYGLSEKQERIMQEIYPKLYEGTLYSKADEAPVRVDDVSRYEYEYSYSYEPTDEELQAIEREFTSTPYPSKDPITSSPTHPRIDQ